MTIDDVKVLKGNMHVLFDSPQGKEVMDYLERACGWYESIYSPADRDLCLINAGKREVVATIKSILKLNPEQILRVMTLEE
jgi:hypothetical protein